jgi:hypothetical protein
MIDAYILKVFIGETLSARVSHLHIRPSTDQVITKTKSSGLCVSTGTGSTSWHTSINRLSQKNVEDLLNILKTQTKCDMNGINPDEVSEEYNRRLVFEPGKRIFVLFKKFINFFFYFSIKMIHDCATRFGNKFVSACGLIRRASSPEILHKIFT